LSASHGLKREEGWGIEKVVGEKMMHNTCQKKQAQGNNKLGEGPKQMNK